MKNITLSSVPLAALVAGSWLSVLSSGMAAKIGINFQDGDGAPVTLDAFGIPAADWVNLPFVPGSNGLAFSTESTIPLPGLAPVAISWSAANTWSAGAAGGIGELEVAVGYLDDPAAGYRVTLDGLRNSVQDYKITLIAGTDGGTGFDPVTLAHTTGPTALTYPTVQPFAGGIYALSDESPVISALASNNRVVITSTAGTNRSTLAGIILEYTPSTTNPPVIETEPTAPPATIYTAQSFSLKVTASGGNLNYQWRRNGTSITGNPTATTPELTITNASGADSGTYDVVVSGSGTPATSAGVPINISPLTQPVFTTLPLAETFYAGYPATFTAAASGGEISYVWTKGATTVGTGPELTFAALTAADAGTYTVTATNPVGNASTSTTLTVTTPPPGTYESIQASQKPLVWYRYNEPGPVSQNTTANSGSLGTEATAVGIFATWPVSGGLLGSSDTGVSLDGATSRIVVPYKAALNPEQFTVEAWVKPSLDGTAAANKCVLACGDFASPRAGWLIYQQPTGWNLRFYDQNGANTSLDLTAGPVPVAGTWYHLAVSFDGTTAKLFVNGTATAGTPTAYVPGTAGSFVIGARSDSNFFWGGTADEVAFYQGALSDAVIQSHYTNGASPTPALPYNTLVTAASPLLYLRLNNPAFTPTFAKNSGTLGSRADGSYRDVGPVPGQPLINLGASGPVTPENPGFTGSNASLSMSNGAAVAKSIVPLGNQVTVTTWIKREPTSTTGDLSWPVWLGDGGMHLSQGTAGNPMAELRYHWKGDQWPWASGLFVPENVWTFAAMVIEPGRATFYMSDIVDGKPVLRTAVNTVNHLALANSSLLAFGGNQPGRADRNYIGQLDETAVYGRSLTRDEIAALYFSGTGAPYTMEAQAGGSLHDTKSFGTPLDGLNFGASWEATNIDNLSATRPGVLTFQQDPGDQIQIPTSPELNNPTGTIMFWMKADLPTGTGSEAAMLFDWRNNNGSVITLANTGNLFIQCAGGANSVTDPYSLVDGVWHHVAVTYNQSAAGTIAVYIDGTLSSEINNSAAWTWPTGIQPLIGKSRDPYWRRFNGQLDDFRIYSQILSVAEINQIKTTGAEVVPSTLELRYDFATPGSGLTLTWPYGFLESSATMQAGDPWTPVPDAVSPFPVAPSGPARFFRARLTP